MRLCINIDHVATLREARGGVEPDPVAAAALCELAGAEGIVCHLREDRRHINDRDLRLLRDTVKTKLNMEMAMTDEILGIAVEIMPDLVTLVPERRQELTTEGGLDVAAHAESVASTIARLHAQDIEVSLFIDPVDRQIEMAAETGADIIELHTGEFANARSEEELRTHLARLKDAAAYARTLGLGVNAGHGINYQNARYIAALTDIEEVSIGHAVISRAVFTGLDAAVRDMIALLHQPRL